MHQNDNNHGENKMKPEQRRTFLDMVDGGHGELIIQDGSPSVEVEREKTDESKNRHREKNGTAPTLNDKKLRSVSAAVAGDFAAGSVPDSEKLGGERGGTRHAAVVAAELDQKEDQEAAQGADRRYVEKVIDVAVPGAVRVAAVVAG